MGHQREGVYERERKEKTERESVKGMMKGRGRIYMAAVGERLSWIFLYTSSWKGKDRIVRVVLLPLKRGDRYSARWK